MVMVSPCGTVIEEDKVENLTEGELSWLIYLGRVHRFNTFNWEWDMVNDIPGLWFMMSLIFFFRI